MARAPEDVVRALRSHWEERVFPTVTSSGVARSILAQQIQATIHDCWQRVRRRSIQQSRLD